MSEKKRLLEALRLRMRRDSMTYAQLAKKISLSEVSIKRYFSEERLTLDVLDQICTAFGASLDELLADLRSVVGSQKGTFTEEQEQVLAKDKFLFQLFFSVARGETYESILDKFPGYKPAKIIRGLRELEYLKLVDFQTEKKLRALISSNAAIRPGGPLWKKYSAAGISKFFDSNFSRQDEFFNVAVGYLSQSSQEQIKRKFETLQEEVYALLALDRNLGPDHPDSRFFWIANGFRPMDSTVLETIAEQSELSSKEE